VVKKPNPWNRAAVARMARELAALAARELVRSEGPVRAPDFQRQTEALLRRRFTPEQIPGVVQAVADASLHLCHPRFMAQQVAAPLPVAALVESVVAALNNSVAVWDMSPAATLVDRDLMRRCKRLFGYPATAEGTLVAGGSFANLTALLAARAALVPTAWQQGGGRVAVLASEHTHYSIARAVGVMGLGTEAVFALPTDGAFRADPLAAPAVFQAARRAGFRRFILVASSGCTPTGSCDDLSAFAALARRQRAWFHVDAAHGGGFAFSRRYRRLLRGIEQADSVVFDPHKMLFMPLIAGAVLVRDGRHLRAAFAQHAPYLFGGTRQAHPNIGEFTLACSQRFDALKMWLVWKAYGAGFWGEMVESVCAATRAAYTHCLRSEVLEPVHRPDCNIFCFRLRRPPRGRRAADRRHWELKEAVNASGAAYISSTVLNGERVLRIVVMNPRTTADDTVAVMQQVEQLSMA